MEEEIFIKDIILKLWQGKYIIIGFTIAAILISLLISLFLITPLYEASAFIDPTYYGMESWDLLQRLDRNAITAKVLSDLPDEEQKLFGKFVLLEKYPQVEVKVTAYKPALAANIANQISKNLLEMVLAVRETSLIDQKLYYERWLVFIEDLITEKYGEENKRNESAELIADPIYLSLMEEKGRSLVAYQNILFSLNELEFARETVSPNIFKPAFVPLQPINMRWKFNTIIAGALGLMLSILAIFIWPYLKELSTFIGSKASE